MTTRTSVVIARQWHAPEITIGVSQDGITLALPLEDFLAALVAEAGSPALTLTQAQQLAKLSQAAERVVTGLKQETVRVM